MEEVHILAYFGKGGYTVNPLDLTGRERDWLIERLNKQYDEDAKAVDKELARLKRK